MNTLSKSKKVDDNSKDSDLTINTKTKQVNNMRLGSKGSHNLDFDEEDADLDLGIEMCFFYYHLISHYTFGII